MAGPPSALWRGLRPFDFFGEKINFSRKNFLFFSLFNFNKLDFQKTCNKKNFLKFFNQCPLITMHR